MSVAVWCDSCGGRLVVDEFDTETRECRSCRGLDPLPAEGAMRTGDQPLSDAERETVIDVDVWFDKSFSVDCSDYGPEQWRELLADVAAGRENHEDFLDGIRWSAEAEVTLTLRGPLAERLKKAAKAAS